MQQMITEQQSVPLTIDECIDALGKRYSVLQSLCRHANIFPNQVSEIMRNHCPDTIEQLAVHDWCHYNDLPNKDLEAVQAILTPLCQKYQLTFEALYQLLRLQQLHLERYRTAGYDEYFFNKVTSQTQDTINTIVQGNIRLAKHTVFQFQPRNRDDFENTLHAAHDGLLAAAQRFKLSMGNNFDTYATHFIRGYIQKSRQKSQKQTSMLSYSLDQENIKEPGKEDTNLDHDEIQESIEVILNQLKTREKCVLMLRYGLANSEPRHLQEISDFLQISTETLTQYLTRKQSLETVGEKIQRTGELTRRIEKKAIEKLRKYFKNETQKRFLTGSVQSKAEATLK